MKSDVITKLYSRIERHRAAIRCDTSPMDNSWADRRAYKRTRYRATTEALLRWTMRKR